MRQLWGFFFVVLAGASFVQQASTAELDERLTRMFDAAAKNIPPAVAAGRAEYDALLKLRPEPRIDYAYGLVLGEQKRYKEAIPLVAKYRKVQPGDLAAGRVHVWLLIQDRKYGLATREMAALAEQVARSTPAAAAEAESTVQFLGAMFGFLDGVKLSAADDQLKRESRGTILNFIGERYLTDFDAGRQDVISQRDALDLERTTAQEQASASQQEQREKAEQAANSNRQRQASQEENVQHSAEQVREAQRAFNVVQRQLQTLQQDRIRVGVQIASIQIQIDTLQRGQVIDNRAAERARSEETMRETPRPGTRWLSGQETRANFRLSPERAAQVQALMPTLAGLNKQAFDMDRQILDLQARASQLVGQGAQELDKLADAESAADAAARRADILEKRAQRPPAANNAKANQITTKMNALATYAPFPFNEERARVLGWFAK